MKCAVPPGIFALYCVFFLFFDKLCQYDLGGGLGVFFPGGFIEKATLVHIGNGFHWNDRN